MSEPTDELAELLAEPQGLEIAGEWLDIGPLVVREIPPFSRALRPLLPRLNAVLAGGEGVTAEVLFDLLAEGEHLVEAVAIAVRKPATWVGGLAADDFLALVLKVLEVNADFFAQRLAPALAGRLALTTAALAGSASASG